MRIVDLTLAIPRVTLETEHLQAPPQERVTMRTRHWTLRDGPAPYTAAVHFFQHWSMAGTYLDLPGHIVETDDGADAASVPAERWFRRAALVIHLDRESGSGPVTAAELAAASPDSDPADALVLNALGARRFDAIAERSVSLSLDAVDWIAARGARLLVADVYEAAPVPHGVFPALFAHGIATVCAPVNLHRLTQPRVRLTALPLRFPGAVQIPCRVLAEEESAETVGEVG